MSVKPSKFASSQWVPRSAIPALKFDDFDAISSWFEVLPLLLHLLRFRCHDLVVPFPKLRLGGKQKGSCNIRILSQTEKVNKNGIAPRP